MGLVQHVLQEHISVLMDLLHVQTVQLGHTQVHLQHPPVFNVQTILGQSMAALARPAVYATLASME